MGEIMERGVFDVMKKKIEEKSQVIEMPVMIEFESEQTNEQADNKKGDELHRTRSHLSSSSDEEIGGGERKRKKNKGLRENIKDSIKNERPTEEEEEEEKMDYKDAPNNDPGANLEEISTKPVEEKKGFLEKIKEILPGQQKKSEEDECTDDNKNLGLMEKIKEKLGGGERKHEEDVKEKSV